MIHKDDNFYVLELSELIKVNRLVRGGINLREFIFGTMPSQRRSRLLLR